MWLWKLIYFTEYFSWNHVLWAFLICSNIPIVFMINLFIWEHSAKYLQHPLITKPISYSGLTLVMIIYMKYHPNDLIVHFIQNKTRLVSSNSSGLQKYFETPCKFNTLFPQLRNAVTILSTAIFNLNDKRSRYLICLRSKYCLYKSLWCLFCLCIFIWYGRNDPWCRKLDSNSSVALYFVTQSYFVRLFPPITYNV